MKRRTPTKPQAPIAPVVYTKQATAQEAKILLKTIYLELKKGFDKENNTIIFEPEKGSMSVAFLTERGSIYLSIID